jgi:hypothetical protein
MDELFRIALSIACVLRRGRRGRPRVTLSNITATTIICTRSLRCVSSLHRIAISSIDISIYDLTVSSDDDTHIHPALLLFTMKVYHLL